MRRLPPWFKARCHQQRGSNAKPAQEAISTLRGEGTRGTAGSRGQVWGRVRGRLQTVLPRLLRSPNLACKMRPRHAARVQRPRGQTPEAIRPEPHTSMTRSRTDTLAHRRTHGHPATHANPGRSANLRVSVLKRFARHSTAVVPLWMAALSRHGSPNPALVLEHGRCHRASPLGII